VKTREGKNVCVLPCCCSGLGYEEWKIQEKYGNDRHRCKHNASQYQARGKNYERDDKFLLLEPIR
jgi:hypothetical protein